jgi:Tfp pilus assembly protein FimT
MDCASTWTELMQSLALLVLAGSHFLSLLRLKRHETHVSELTATLAQARDMLARSLAERGSPGDH